ncbi:MAG: ribosome small subunit-dependent GTPase A [Acidobacteria bacterium]|nr:ribosome small subunit-dependent GTPase A [Acidobacteriota bacterium]
MADDALGPLGWTAARAEAFEPWRREELVPGRVSLEHNHVYRVLTADGEVLAEAAGRLKHEAQARAHLPVVGDWVALRLEPAGPRSQIRAVLPRTSAFARKSAGRTTEAQIVAANIDTVFVVFALDERFSVRAIERYLVAARLSGAVPVIVLNKADLAGDPAALRDDVRRTVGDVRVCTVSARTGAGLDALEAYLVDGRTAALLGPSGVGKSSLVNRLVGAEMLPTGDVRTWDARGRHTSVHRQLVRRAAGGLIIDTPGMRELQLWDPEGVADAFEDVAELSASCRFRDCRHDREPGCAVKAAVEAGALDAHRYANFLKLQAEQTEIERRREERARETPERQVKARPRGPTTPKDGRPGR